MQYMEDTLFHTANGTQLTLQAVVSEIIKFMCTETHRAYTITLGTDSLQGRGGHADFVTAIVIHRIGGGGRYFWHRTELEHIHSLRYRMTQEVLMSLEAAKNFLHLLELAVATGIDIPQYKIEIHVDVGENGETRTMIQELVGMIRANNFEAKTKPESYAASCVADKHV